MYRPGKDFAIIHIVNERTSFVCVACYRILPFKKKSTIELVECESITQHNAKLGFCGNKNF